MGIALCYNSSDHETTITSRMLDMLFKYLQWARQFIHAAANMGTGDALQ